MRRFILSIVMLAAVGAAAAALQDDGALVDPLDARFLPRWEKEHFYQTYWWHEYQARMYSRSFVALPVAGPGYRAAGAADILWGRPEIVDGFRNGAAAWSLAGGPPVEVYAISPSDITTGKVDNAERTFALSHIYGNRSIDVHAVGYLPRYVWPAVGDLHHIQGASIDIREFRSDAMNDAFLAAVRQEKPLKLYYIYDMLTREQICADEQPVNTPLHIEAELALPTHLKRWWNEVSRKYRKNHMDAWWSSHCRCGCPAPVIEEPPDEPVN